MRRMGAVLALAFVACAKGDAGPTGPEGRIAVNVAALDYPGVTDARYRITVWNGASPRQKVWENDTLTSSRYGDGAGSLAYVGACDASANDNTVELAILDLYSGPDQRIPAGDYVNPAPDDDPISIAVTCAENTDVAVRLNLTVMRRAEQGFFDIGVEFEDIFCSAKFDCLKDGQPIELLHNPATGRRDMTVVLGFACTTGRDGAAEATPTWLHMSNVLVECEDEGGDPVTYLVSPNGEGQVGPVGNIFYEVGVYHGQEDLPGYDKCYWNMAFGVKLTSALKNCRLRADGTASTGSWAPTGTSLEDTVYPYVHWDIDLTGNDGQLACSAHKLDDDSGHVATAYTGMSGASFAQEWECGDDTPITTSGLVCAGSTNDQQVSFQAQPGGFSLAFGNQVTDSDNYFALPAEWTLGADAACCTNPCCAE